MNKIKFILLVVIIEIISVKCEVIDFGHKSEENTRSPNEEAAASVTSEEGRFLQNRFTAYPQPQPGRYRRRNTTVRPDKVDQMKKAIIYLSAHMKRRRRIRPRPRVRVAPTNLPLSEGENVIMISTTESQFLDNNQEQFIKEMTHDGGILKVSKIQQLRDHPLFQKPDFQDLPNVSNTQNRDDGDEIMWKINSVRKQNGNNFDILYPKINQNDDDEEYLSKSINPHFFDVANATDLLISESSNPYTNSTAPFSSDLGSRSNKFQALHPLLNSDSVLTNVESKIPEDKIIGIEHELSDLHGGIPVEPDIYPTRVRKKHPLLNSDSIIATNYESKGQPFPDFRPYKRRRVHNSANTKLVMDPEIPRNISKVMTKLFANRHQPNATAAPIAVTMSSFSGVPPTIKTTSELPQLSIIEILPTMAVTPEPESYSTGHSEYSTEVSMTFQDSYDIPTLSDPFLEFIEKAKAASPASPIPTVRSTKRPNQISTTGTYRIKQSETSIPDILSTIDETGETIPAEVVATENFKQQLQTVKSATSDAAEPPIIPVGVGDDYSETLTTDQEEAINSEPIATTAMPKPKIRQRTRRPTIAPDLSSEKFTGEPIKIISTSSSSDDTANAYPTESQAVIPASTTLSPIILNIEEPAVDQPPHATTTKPVSNRIRTRPPIITTTLTTTTTTTLAPTTATTTEEPIIVQPPPVENDSLADLLNFFQQQPQQVQQQLPQDQQNGQISQTDIDAIIQQAFLQALLNPTPAPSNPNINGFSGSDMKSIYALLDSQLQSTPTPTPTTSTTPITTLTNPTTTMNPLLLALSNIMVGNGFSLNPLSQQASASTIPPIVDQSTTLTAIPQPPAPTPTDTQLDLLTQLLQLGSAVGGADTQKRQNQQSSQQLQQQQSNLDLQTLLGGNWFNSLATTPAPTQPPPAFDLSSLLGLGGGNWANAFTIAPPVTTTSAPEVRPSPTFQQQNVFANQQQEQPKPKTGPYFWIDFNAFLGQDRNAASMTGIRPKLGQRDYFLRVK